MSVKRLILSLLFVPFTALATTYFGDIPADTDVSTLWQSPLGYTPENVANKSTSTSLGTSDTLYPSQKATKTYVDNAISGIVAGVSSWNSRTGAVVPLSGDYSDSDISFTDNTTNDSSTSNHGYFPKLSGDPTLFFNGQGQQVAVLGGQNQGTRLISGGGVVWTGTGLNFVVAAADYIINGVEYTSPQTSLTLSAADPSLDRIDTFYVDDAGTANFITGVPAVNPVAPNVDPATQLYLTFAYVPAGSTIPNITNVDIYKENTEWTMSSSSGSINVNSTSNPCTGSKDIEGTSVAAGAFFTGVKPSGTLKPSDYTNLNFKIKSKATWPNPKAISIFWMNGSTAVGVAATLKQGAFGFDSSNTSSCQQIVIPASTFNTGTSSIDRIRFQVTGGGSSIGWYIDDIILQASGGGGTGGGDFSTNTTTSVDGEIVLFSGATGKLGRRSTGTGLAQLVNGVLTSPTPAPLTKTDDTNVTLTLGGSPTTALVNSASITAGWTGTLSQARGGFGKSSASVTDGQIPIGKTSDGSWNFNTVTAGTGISVTNGGGTITIANTGVTSSDVSDTAFASSWNGVTGTAPSKNAVYDEIHLFDTADDGSILNAGTGFRIGGAAASGKILVGNGTNYVASTPTFPNASATSGKVIKSDGTNWVASTETYAAPSTSGNVLTSDGTNWTSAAPVVTASNTVTFTNKRTTPRITTITSSGTPTINTDNCDAVTITAQAAAITSMTTNLSGTPNNFDKLIFRIKDDGTARAITWGASFAARGVSLPTTTVISKVLYVGFIYNTVTSTWDCVASAQEQ